MKFRKDSTAVRELSSSKYTAEMCQFTRIPMTKRASHFVAEFDLTKLSWWWKSAIKKNKKIRYKKKWSFLSPGYKWGAKRINLAPNEIPFGVKSMAILSHYIPNLVYFFLKIFFLQNVSHIYLLNNIPKNKKKYTTVYFYKCFNRNIVSIQIYCLLNINLHNNLIWICGDRSFPL